MSVDLDTPEAQKLIADAKALGAQVEAEALTFAHAVIVTLGSDAAADVPDISAAALSLVYGLIPAQERGTVQMIVGAIGGGTIKNVDSIIVSQATAALGTVSNRLAALTPAPAASSPSAAH